jgi:serine/threonine-protein phosphatase 5
LAIEDATQAIKLDPNFAKAYYRRASANLSILNPKAALPDLRKVVALEPKNATVRTQLEDTKKLAYRIEFEKAIASQEGTKAWVTAATHLLEGTGGTTIDPKYEGPRIEDGDEDAENVKDTTRRGKHLGKISETFINDMIDWFRKGNKLPLRYCWQIILGARRQFEKEPTMVEYQVKEGTTATVYGDIHGQLFDFLHAFDLSGRPSEKNMLLFNGDFVDRGNWGCECLLILLAYKWLMPSYTYLNRGNHETSSMNQTYGFAAEVKAKFGGEMTFKLFTDLFVALPLATTITATKEPVQGADLPTRAPLAQRSPILTEDGHKRYFVVHGGLPQEDDVTLDMIRALDRFKIGQPSEGIAQDLLWADPQAARGRAPSKRGVGKGFGPDIAKQWCQLNKITAILRSHEVRNDGYEEEHDGLTVTIFSASNYVDQVGNKGAFARIDAHGTIDYIQFEAQPHPDMRPMHYVSGAMGGMLQ